MFDQKVKLPAPINLNKALYAPNRVQMERKYGFQEPWVISHSVYVQLLLINLVSSINWEV